MKFYLAIALLCIFVFFGSFGLATIIYDPNEQPTGHTYIPLIIRR